MTVQMCVYEQMQSDYKLAEARLVSLNSQMEASSSQLHEVENQLSSRRAELEQGLLKLVETPVRTEKLFNKVCR